MNKMLNNQLPSGSVPSCQLFNKYKCFLLNINVWLVKNLKKKQKFVYKKCVCLHLLTAIYQYYNIKSI